MCRTKMFGCLHWLFAVGNAQDWFPKAISEIATQIELLGMDWMKAVEMGPVITNDSRKRIEGLIQTGIDEGGTRHC